MRRLLFGLILSAAWAQTPLPSPFIGGGGGGGTGCVPAGGANQVITSDGAGGCQTVTTSGSGNGILQTSPTIVTPTIASFLNATHDHSNAAGGGNVPIGSISGMGSGVGTFLVTPSSANLASAVTNETGSGALVFGTSPALITPDLGTPTVLVLTSATGTPTAIGLANGTGLPLTTGVTGVLPTANIAVALANQTSINGLGITASTGTLTITNAKTFSALKTLTLDGTDSTTMTFPSTSATIARTDAANTFTGTQTIGALVATTVNGNTFTTGTGVLTIAAAKTLTASNTLTLAGTDSTTMTFPTTSATIARTDAANTFTGVQTMTSPALTTPAITTSGTLSNNGIAATSTDGFILQNTTASTVSVTAQWSPRLHFIGQGWKGNATAANQQTEWTVEAVPVTKGAQPSNSLIFTPIRNGSTSTASLGFCQSSDTNPKVALTGLDGTTNPNICDTGTGWSGFGGVGATSVIGAYTNASERVLVHNNGMSLSSTGSLFWTVGSLASAIVGDTGLCRGAAGQVNINDGSATCTNQRDLGVRSLANYNSVATAGMGVPPIYASASQTGQTASIGTTNLQCGAAVCPAGLYRVSVYTDVTSTGTGTLTSTIGWSDPAAARTITSVGIATTATNYERVDYTIRADGVANITYATTESVSGTYSIYVTLERLQ